MRDPRQRRYKNDKCYRHTRRDGAIPPRDTEPCEGEYSDGEEEETPEETGDGET